MDEQLPPGTEKPRRVPPRGVRYELVSCGLAGHELIGTEAAELRDEDALVAREDPVTGLRWHRCVRCDSWVALPRPDHPTRPHPPDRDEIALPLRGRPLRDKYVLRLIAIDRFLHFVVLAALAGAVFYFGDHKSALQSGFYRVLTDVQGGLGGPTHNAQGGVLEEIRRAFTLSNTTLDRAGGVILAYALLELTEGVGLWLRKRWAEYLTFVATILLLPFEVYELTHRVSPFKILALIVNLLIAAYLIYAKRLFGVRGGGRAEREEIERDSGWEALERSLPTPRERAATVGS